MNPHKNLYCEENIPVSDRWVQIFTEMRKRDVDVEKFCNIVEFILCLPGSIAPAERIFSVMNTMWSKEKSRLSDETMRVMLVVRQNCDMECEKFCDKVLKDRNLLRKIRINVHGTIVVKYNPFYVFIDWCMG